MTDRPVIVTDHAVSRARRRWRDTRTRGQLRAHILREVIDALEHGRVSNHKPAAFRLYGQRARQLRTGERFVHNEAGTHGWIIVREPDRDVVVTSLHRVQTTGTADVRGAA